MVPARHAESTWCPAKCDTHDHANLCCRAQVRIDLREHAILSSASAVASMEGNGAAVPAAGPSGGLANIGEEEG